MQDQINRTICNLMRGTPASYGFEFIDHGTYQPFVDLVAQGYDAICLDDPATDLTSLRALGFDPSFLEAAAGGHHAFATSLLDKLGVSRETYNLPVGVSARSVVNIFGIEKRARPLLDPFTGRPSYSTASVSRGWYLLPGGPNLCLAVEASEVMSFMGVESLWILPEKRCFAYIRSGFPEDHLRRMIGLTFFELYWRYEKILAYLGSDRPRRMALNDFHVPHVGHNLWNVQTGWANVLRFKRAPVDVLIEHDNHNFFGSLQELFPDETQGTETLVARTEGELIDRICDGNLLAFQVKDEFITDDLREKVLSRARRSVPKAQQEEIGRFRAHAWPLLLITVRLGNRSWIGQEEGWAELILALKDTYPRLGVVFDGLNSDTVKGWTTGFMSLEEELRCVDEIERRIGGDVPVFRAVGRTFSEAILLADAIDAFVAPIGSGMTLYRWLTNKPGVGVSNRVVLDPHKKYWPLRVWEHYCETIDPYLLAPPSMVYDVDIPGQEASRANFTLDWCDLHVLLRDYLKARFPPDDPRPGPITP